MRSERSVTKKYAALFKTKGVPALVAAMVVARMPTGCITLLLVLVVSNRFGAATAGLASAMWTLGMALAAPALGRLVDRGCGPRTLRITAAAEALATVLLLASTGLAAPAPVVVACAFACGALNPPVAGTTRSLWQVTVPSNLLAVAYSFEVLLIDVLYVSGPLVASAFIAFGAADAGIAFTSACLVGGSIALAASPSVKAYASLALDRRRGKDSPSQQPSSAKESEGSGAETKTVTLMRKPAVWLVLLACIGTMAFSGWIETLLPLYFDAEGLALHSGTAISVWSIGSIIGVFAFVRFQPSARKVRLGIQLAFCTALYLAACAALALQGSFLSLCAILFLIGVLVSPCTNLHYQLGGAAAPSHQHAEMFSWLNTATSAGISLGALLAGSAVEVLGMTASFILPCSFVALSLTFAIALAATKH